MMVILLRQDGCCGARRARHRFTKQCSGLPESGEQKSAATEAEHWLEDYLTMHGGTDPSAKIKKAAYAAGHTERSLRTARSG
jgi:hypothetical protein